VATAVQENVTVDNEIEVDDSKRKLSEDKITAVQQNGATQVLLPKVKEQVIVKEEEAPLPGLVLTTKQTKTFKVECATMIHVYDLLLVHQLLDQVVRLFSLHGIL
jgi:hypothetical protein